MARRITIRDDRRGMDRLKRKVQAASQKSVVIGITNEAGGDVLKYANYNEFGVTAAQAKPHSFQASPKGSKKPPVWYHVSGIIPSRPFLRSYYDENLDNLYKFASNRFLQFLTVESYTLDTAFNAIGLYGQNGVKNRIRTSKSWAVPNAPLTVLLKGSDKPLVDHGILINTVTFDIRSSRV